MIRKIFKYRILIGQVCLLFIKYKVSITFRSNHSFIQKVCYLREKQLANKHYLKPLQPKEDLIGLTNRILLVFSPYASCLLKALVKCAILSKYGYYEPIYVGIYKDNNILKAHAWLSNERILSYNKIYEI